MEGLVDFTIGLSDNVAWPWPIAVYLFLAGISGGAIAVALFLMKMKKLPLETPVVKAASLIAFGTIVLGMVCLVADLTNPLVFWRILIYYNPTSVMSIGVMMLLMYIPSTFLFTLCVLREEFSFIPLVKPIGDLLAKFLPALSWFVIVLAVGVCAYTGFLISALIRFPLINTAVLPALFIASGMSAGTAATAVVAAALFKADRESAPMHFLHVVEWPIMFFEAFMIFMIAAALLNGIAVGQQAVHAFVTGVWAQVFWIGAIGIGMGVPVVLQLLHKLFPPNWAVTFYAAGLASVCGMMCLRMFILYAGQTYSLMQMTY